MRSFTFKCAVALVFLRFSFLPETIAYFTGINTYLLYVFGPLALIGVVAFGGLKRTFHYAPARFWLAFLVYMFLAVPFSSWRGDSFMLAQTYIRTGFIMLLVTAGLAMTWVECRSMIYAIALATVFNLATAHLLMSHAADSDRLFFQSKGMISDPNDLAAHLLLVLPFLLFVILRPRTFIVIRLILAGAMLYGLFLILRSGSRGGFVALILTLAVVFVVGSARQRLVVGIAAPVLLVVLVALLPGSTWKRLKSIAESSEASDAAASSSEARKYLLKKSIEFTLKKPIFGVGPGQFQNFEGISAAAEGRHGSWHATHNTYTQVSSECGIPALAFFLGALFSTFGILQKIRKKALAMNKKEIVTAAFCITLGLTGYTSASLFLANAYRFQFLAISGLVVAIWHRVSKDRSSPRFDKPLVEQADQAEGAELNLLGA
jgi:O-antigen ligase